MSKKIKAYQYDNNKKDYIEDGNCIIPFIYKNKIYTDCFKTKKGKICATKVDSKKRMVKYGICLDKLNT